MGIGEICNREVVVTGRDTSVNELAALMREFHVGDLVVVDDRDGIRIPVGIVTDRDIVVGVIGNKVAPEEVIAEEIMSTPVATVREDEGLFETLQCMRQHGVRRLPVVNKEGVLVGIMALDDLIELIAEELSAMAKVIRREQEKEKQIRVRHRG